MKDYKEELIKYCECTMNARSAKTETKKDWIFGAVDYAFRVDLIDRETYLSLSDKYQLT